MISTLIPYAEYINNGNPQYCNIRITPRSGSAITLTEADIKQGGFNYDARSTSGDVIEVGSAVAAQLILTLEANGTFDAFDWYGARIDVAIGVESNGTVVYGNLGQFTVDEADRKYDIWTITALDNLVKFDKLLTTANWNTINNGSQTVSNLIRVASTASGVSVGVLDDLLNSGVTLPTVTPQENTTWRNILQWCGEIAGVCFYCDGIGRLCSKWYGDAPTRTDAITLSHETRYKSNVSADDIELTGVLVITEQDGNTIYNYSPDYDADNPNEYRVQIEGNPFFSGDNLLTFVSALGGRLDGFYYAPFDAQTVPYIYLSPLDWCYIADNTVGANIPSIITHIAFTLNGACAVESVGKSVQSKSYSNSSAFTRQQSVMVNAVKEQMTEYVGARERALTELNTLMANAMGLQATTIDGKWYAYYSPDNTGIDNATIVYTLTTGGLAWATSFDSEHPELTDWKYGISAEGNAILNQIYVTGITVDDGVHPFATKILPESWKLVYNGDQELIVASGSTGQGILTLDKVQMTGNGYIRMGKARMYGTSTGMDIVIED